MSYRLRDILSRDSSLACEWLGKRLPVGLTALSDRDLKLVMVDLDDQQRSVLLDQIPADSMASKIISLLIDRRPEVYRKLLSLDRLGKYGLCPLEGIPDAAWSEIALVALDNGYQPAEIAKQSFNEGGAVNVMIWGHDPSHWRRWEDAFAGLEEHSDRRLREVARLGREEAQGRIGAAAGRRHEFDLTGKVVAQFGFDLV